MHESKAGVENSFNLSQFAHIPKSTLLDWMRLNSLTRTQSILTTVYQRRQ